MPGLPGAPPWCLVPAQPPTKARFADHRRSEQDHTKVIDRQHQCSVLTPASRDCLLVKYRLLSHLVIFHSPTLFGPPSALSLLLSASSFSASLGSNVNVACCLCVLRGAGGFDYFSHKYSVNGNVFDAVVRLLLIAYCCADSVLTRAAQLRHRAARYPQHPPNISRSRHLHTPHVTNIVTRHVTVTIGLHHLFIYIQCMSGDPKSHCLQVYCLDSGPLSPLYSGMSFILF